MAMELTKQSPITALVNINELRPTLTIVIIYPGPGSETWVPISLRCGYPGTRVPIYNLKVT